MRSSVQRAIGGYRADLPHSGDFEMWMRAAVVADVGRVNGADQAFYRVHDDSMLRTTYSSWLHDLEGRRDAFLAILGPDVADRPADADALLTMARRGLATEALTRARRALDDPAFDQQDASPNIEPGLEPAGGDSVPAYRAFALDVYPPARELRAWGLLERRAARPDRSRLGRSVDRFALRLQESLRWHRWRWTGE